MLSRLPNFSCHLQQVELRPGTASYMNTQQETYLLLILLATEKLWSLDKFESSTSSLGTIHDQVWFSAAIFSVHSFWLLWDRRRLGSLNICHTSIRCHASVVNSTHTLTLYCKQRNNVANNDMPEVLERWWSQQPASAEGWWWGCSWGHGSACEHHSHLSHKVGPVVDSTQLHSVVDVGRNLFIRCIMRFTTLRGQWSLP